MLSKGVAIQNQYFTLSVFGGHRKTGIDWKYLVLMRHGSLLNYYQTALGEIEGES